MEIGNDPDFGNTHGEEPFECYVRIEGEAAGRRTKGAGDVDTHGGAGARENETRWGSRHVKRLIDEGYDTVQGFAELDTEDLAEAGMRKGDAKLIMGRVSQSARHLVEKVLRKMAKVRLTA